MELDAHDRRAIGAAIAKVEFGWPIGLPSCRPMGEGLFEVRANISDGRIARVLFGLAGGQMVLVHGFIKNSDDAGVVMNEKAKSGRIGSSFDEFLEAEGIREEVEGLAIKALIADQLQGAMKAEGLTKVGMARRMRTTRQQLDRLLDPTNPSVTMSTLQRAAKAVGRSLTIRLS